MGEPLTVPPSEPRRIDQTLSDEATSPPVPTETRPWLFIVYGNDRSRHIELRPTPISIGRGPGADIELQDERVSKVHCRVRIADGGAVEIEDNGSRNGTFVDGQRIQQTVLGPHSEIRLGQTVMRVEHKGVAEVRFEEEIYRAAVTDPLTGVANRRTFADRSAIELARAARYKFPVSAIFLDIDHFKKINDTYGHPAGDAVLREVARRMNASRRAEDLLCRYGGEEFVLLASCAALEASVAFAERIRIEIHATPVQAGEESIPVTLSGGVSLLRPGESLEALLGRADAALYRAKSNGRNRIEREK